MSKKNQPIYRAKFCAVTGADEKGNDILGKSVEIGAVWERKDPSKGAVLKLDCLGPLKLCQRLVSSWGD